MKLTMRLGPRSYDIILSRGALGRLGQLANLMNRRVLVVTDDGVPAQHADTVLAQCTQGWKLVPVSYTHLDVYKRQGYAARLL